MLRPYVFAFLGLFLVAAIADLGWRRTMFFAVWVWPLAWVSEFASTRVGIPFGLYHYTGLTRGRELFVADVPFMDSVSFVFLAYAAFCLTRVVLGRRGGATQALVGGFLMMLLDVVIDPAAVRGERWFLGHVFEYAQSGAYFGVPLSNFAGWWAVGAAAIAGYTWLTGEPGGRRTRPGVALYYAVIGFNLAVTAWIGEASLFVVGLMLHAVLALGLLAVGRGVETYRRFGTGRVQSA